MCRHSDRCTNGVDCRVPSVSSYIVCPPGRCDNFLYGFKGAPFGRARPSGPSRVQTRDPRKH
jgi:hypothetical protein